MKFEYDARKSRANRAEHGIDFEQARRLWTGEVLEIPARTEDEPRWLVIGMINDVHWSAVITRRQGDITRIISVRRSRHQEREWYNAQFPTHSS